MLDEVSRLMNKWLHDSSLKDIAFKALMVMPNVETFTAFKRYLFLEKSSMIDCVLNAPLKCITLNHSFPMHYFSTP